MAEAGRGDLRGDRCAALVVKVGGARLRVLVLWDLGERTVMGGGMRLTVDGGTMRVWRFGAGEVGILVEGGGCCCC